MNENQFSLLNYDLIDQAWSNILNIANLKMTKIIDLHEFARKFEKFFKINKQKSFE
jgi:hypothetical protein